MNKLLFFLFFLCLAGSSMAQEEDNFVPVADSLYREDQFYAGVTYNLIVGGPENLNLDGVSGGIHFGYLRDMPINKNRNIAIAVGAGLAFDQYGQNLFIGEEENSNSIFRVLDDTVDFDSNKLSTATLEIPIEFRWRTSTASLYKFWRVYCGIRAGYTYWYRSSFKQPGNEVAQTDIPEFEKFRLGATLSFGYTTFNFYAHYTLTPFFSDANTVITGEDANFNALKLGIIFYIL